MKELNAEIRQSINKKAEDLKDMWSIFWRLSKTVSVNILNVAQILIVHRKCLLYDRKPNNNNNNNLYIA